VATRNIAPARDFFAARSRYSRRSATTMTERDNKTVRWGAIGVVIYLAAFGGFKMWRTGGANRDDYQTVLKRAEQLQVLVRDQENKVLLFEKLSDEFKFDPRKIKKETLVEDASA